MKLLLERSTDARAWGHNFLLIGLLYFMQTSSVLAQTGNHHQKQHLQKNHQQKSGLVVVEAEDFAAQHKDDKRRWIIFSKETPAHAYADSDLPHYADASAGKYIEILPDTRTNHFETLVRGENFSNVPGEVAVLSYPVYFESAGKYYVWARAYSSGSEDNGVHFGLNGQWPESGQRLQLCTGKHQWTWSSAQRIATNHCGTPNTVTLDIQAPGVHNIMISMREDGFELDKFLLTTDANYVPTGMDASQTLSVQPAFATKDMLLGIDEYSRIFYAASDFTANPSNSVPLYPLELQQALAINTSEPTYQNTFAYAQVEIDRRDAGKRKLTLVVLGQADSISRFKVLLNDKEIGRFSSTKVTENLQEQYFEINNLNLKQGDIISIASMAVFDAQALPDAETTQPSTSPGVGGLWRAVVISREQ